MLDECLSCALPGCRKFRKILGTSALLFTSYTVLGALGKLLELQFARVDTADSANNNWNWYTYRVCLKAAAAAGAGLRPPDCTHTARSWACERAQGRLGPALLATHNRVGERLENDRRLEKRTYCSVWALILFLQCISTFSQAQLVLFNTHVQLEIQNHHLAGSWFWLEPVIMDSLRKIQTLVLLIFINALPSSTVRLFIIQKAFFIVQKDVNNHRSVLRLVKAIVQLLTNCIQRSSILEKRKGKDEDPVGFGVSNESTHQNSNRK